MSTIVIVGAGEGLGLAIARAFGVNGFNVALISRTQSKLDSLADRLHDEGINARGFAADIMDRTKLTTAIGAAKDHFGGIDVLEFSPAPHNAPVAGLEMVDAASVTVENIAPQIEYYLYAAIAATQAVLPDMIARGSGTLLFTTGAGSVSPIPMMGNINAAAAALRNWAVNLHTPLRDHGVHVAHIAIGVYIGSGPEENSADVIARTYWDTYQSRDGAERIYTSSITEP